MTDTRPTDALIAHNPIFKAILHGVHRLELYTFAGGCQCEEKKYRSGNSVGYRQMRQKVVLEHYIACHCNLLTALLCEPRVLGHTNKMSRME